MTIYPSITFKKLILQLATNCFRHCYRGNPSGGRLWIIFTINQKSTIGIFEIKKITKDGFGIGYFNEEQLWCTKFVDCPLKYLDLVPCPKDKNTAQWRQKVYEYHNNRVAKRLEKKEAKIAAKKLEEIKYKKPKELTLAQKEQKILNALEDYQYFDKEYFNPFTGIFGTKNISKKEGNMVDESLGHCPNCNFLALYKDNGGKLICSWCGAVHAFGVSIEVQKL